MWGIVKRLLADDLEHPAHPPPPSVHSVHPVDMTVETLTRNNYGSPMGASGPGGSETCKGSTMGGGVTTKWRINPLSAGGWTDERQAGRQQAVPLPLPGHLIHSPAEFVAPQGTSESHPFVSYSGWK